MSASLDLKCTHTYAHTHTRTQLYNEKKVQGAQCLLELPDHWSGSKTAPLPQRPPSFSSTSVSQTWKGGLGESNIWVRVHTHSLSPPVCMCMNVCTMQHTYQRHEDRLTLFELADSAASHMGVCSCECGFKSGFEWKPR